MKLLKVNQFVKIRKSNTATLGKKITATTIEHNVTRSELSEMISN